MRRLLPLALAAALLQQPSVRSEEPLDVRTQALFAAMYDFAVCDYCGLITGAVYRGFHRQVRELVARHGLDEETVRRVRIRAWTAADLEHGNRGLGGFRQWCRSEGAAAAERFAGYDGVEFGGGAEP